MGIQRVPNLLRWTVLACCLPYPCDPKSAIDCFFLFGISLHPGVTGSAPHWKFRGCRVHSFPSPQESLRPASWLALLSRTFTFEVAPTRSPSISVEYDYVDKQSIPTAGLSPASPTALWAAGHRISHVLNVHSRYGLSARCIAKATHLSRGLRRFRYLHRRSDSYRLERPSCRVGIAPTGDQHLFWFFRFKVRGLGFLTVLS